MKGIGGPLLCIGDLLSDVGEEGKEDGVCGNPNSCSSSALVCDSPDLDLTKLFQENYDQLNRALDGTDHSWTALTLKLCTALETANKLVHSTNKNVGLLSEKVVELEKTVKRGDSAVAAARAIHFTLNQRKKPSIEP